MSFDQCDLELYRWMIHTNLYVKQDKVQKMRKEMMPQYWWKEFGAFVSTLPRRIGKSTMLIKLTNKFILESPPEKYAIVTATINMKDDIIRMGANRNHTYTLYELDDALKHGGYPILCPDTHLLVDEYNSCGSTLDVILTYPWKSVTMVGTLR